LSARRAAPKTYGFIGRSFFPFPHRGAMSFSGAMRIIISAIILVSAIVSTGVGQSTAPPAANPPPEAVTRILDNSDWWSVYSAPDEDQSAIPQHRTVSAANFSVLGVKLDEHMFEHADAKLGRATRVQRGDASTGRTQICYASVGEPVATYLIFEQGEIDFSLYLFKAGKPWNGAEFCIRTPRVGERVATATGIHPGVDQATLRKILGRPSSQAPSEIRFDLSALKPNSKDDLANARRANPHSSESDPQKDDGSVNVGQSFDARFTEGKLTYFSASYSETD
jgi:hypothetical protein